MEKIRLQPLRIPTGWSVHYNTFCEIGPESMLENNELVWICLTEDLLQIQHIRHKLLIDLGWYPEGDVNGHYNLLLIKDFDWDSPIKSFSSDGKEKIVNMIESLLELYAEGID